MKKYIIIWASIIAYSLSASAQSKFVINYQDGENELSDSCESITFNKTGIGENINIVTTGDDSKLLGGTDLRNVNFITRKLKKVSPTVHVYKGDSDDEATIREYREDGTLVLSSGASKLPKAGEIINTYANGDIPCMLLHVDSVKDKGNNIEVYTRKADLSEAFPDTTISISLGNQEIAEAKSLLVNKLMSTEEEEYTDFIEWLFQQDKEFVWADGNRPKALRERHFVDDKTETFKINLTDESATAYYIEYADPSEASTREGKAVNLNINIDYGYDIYLDFLYKSTNYIPDLFGIYTNSSCYCGLGLGFEYSADMKKSTKIRKRIASIPFLVPIGACSIPLDIDLNILLTSKANGDASLEYSMRPWRFSFEFANYITRRPYKKDRKNLIDYLKSNPLAVIQVATGNFAVAFADYLIEALNYEKHIIVMDANNPLMECLTSDNMSQSIAQTFAGDLEANFTGELDMSAGLETALTFNHSPNWRVSGAYSLGLKVNGDLGMKLRIGNPLNETEVIDKFSLGTYCNLLASVTGKVKKYGIEKEWEHRLMEKDNLGTYSIFPQISLSDIEYSDVLKLQKLPIEFNKLKTTWQVYDPTDLGFCYRPKNTKEWTYVSLKDRFEGSLTDRTGTCSIKEGVPTDGLLPETTYEIKPFSKQKSLITNNEFIIYKKGTTFKTGSLINKETSGATIDDVSGEEL